MELVVNEVGVEEDIVDGLASEVVEYAVAVAALWQLFVGKLVGFFVRFDIVVDYFD